MLLRQQQLEDTQDKWSYCLLPSQALHTEGRVVEGEVGLITIHSLLRSQTLLKHALANSIAELYITLS